MQQLTRHGLGGGRGLRPGQQHAPLPRPLLRRPVQVAAKFGFGGGAGGSEDAARKALEVGGAPGGGGMYSALRGARRGPGGGLVPRSFLAALAP
jgi:hypothetical protein